MGSARARARRQRALEAKFEKTHMRRAQFAVGTEAPKQKAAEKRPRQDDGLSRDMRKMLRMKRLMEERKLRSLAPGGGPGVPPGRGDGVNTKNGKDITELNDGNGNNNNNQDNNNGDVRVGQGHVHERELEQGQTRSNENTMEKKRTSRNKYAHLQEEEKMPLSKSKQRKKEYMRNKKKGKAGPGQLPRADEHDNDSSEDDIDTTNKVAFGEQADAPMKEVLRSKHWAERPKREGVDPAVSIVGLGATMGVRRVKGMDSQALAALYKQQKKRDGHEDGSTSNKATLQSLKQLVRQGHHH